MENTAISPTPTATHPLALLRRSANPDAGLIELPEAHLTVRQNLTYFSRRFPASSTVLEKRIGYICKALNLYSFMDMRYSECSVFQKVLVRHAHQWIDSDEEIPDAH